MHELEVDQPEGNINHPPPLLQGHRRQYGLHDERRRHGADRYQAYPRDLPNRQNQAHLQYYQFHWETVEERWIWLRPNWGDRTRARCIVCHINMGANINTVQRHGRSLQHMRHMEEYVIPVDEYDHHLDLNEFENEKAAIKILLSAWFANECVAYRKIDTLLPLIQRIARYPGAIQEMKLSRTDMSKINSRVIAPVYKRELADMISNTKFATLFDESTSTSRDKHGCLLVRFADERKYSIRTVLWDLIPIYRDDDEHSNATAEALYNLTINSLFGEDLAHEENRVVLQRENYIAVGSDGCNTMIGVHNSVAQRCRLNFPGISIIICSCHCCHLCGGHAIAEIPGVLDLCIDCYNWFCSPKRKHALTQNQINLNIEVHKLLRFIPTRWLTAVPALIRLDEQMIAIDATLAAVPDAPQAVNILQQLRIPQNQLYIAFLKFILETVEDLNGWLQSEEVILPEVFDRITRDFKDILMCYMQREYVENANLLIVDTEDANNFLPDDEINIGINARLIAEQLPEDQYLDVMRVIRQYLVHLANEWSNLLVEPWAPFQCTESLLMHNALSVDYHQDNPNVIDQLLLQFPRCIPMNFRNAFLAAIAPHVQGIINPDIPENLRNAYLEFEELIQHQWNALTELDLQVLHPESRTDYFWFIIKNMENEDGHLFQELGTFVLNILSIPHSNAQPERIWSIEKIIHTKLRNKLSLKSIKAIIQIRECLIFYNCEKAVHRFIPTREMVRRVRFRTFDDPQFGPMNEMNDFGEMAVIDNEEEEMLSDEDNDWDREND